MNRKIWKMPIPSCSSQIPIIIHLMINFLNFPATEVSVNYVRLTGLGLVTQDGSGWNHGTCMARHGAPWFPWDTSNLPYIYIYTYIIIYVICIDMIFILAGKHDDPNIWETYLGETYVYIYIHIHAYIKK